MEYRNLGKAGLKISALSFGSWVTFGKQLDLKGATRCMSIAYEAGVNFFDNAEAYEHGESERIMGEVLHALGWSRDSYCVSSKVFWGGEKPTQKGLSHKHIIDACNAALSRLKVDYLDLYFCHRPDPDTPVEETVRAMHTLVHQGKIFYWGTSEWSAEQIHEAYTFAERNYLTPPTMEQPQYNLFERKKMEKEYLTLFSQKRMGTTIWSPLASGLLTGKYNHGVPKESRLNLPGYEWLKDIVHSENFPARVEKLKLFESIAMELGITQSQLAIAWCLKNRNVSSVILGASSDQQLLENLKSIDALPKLTNEIITKIEKIFTAN